MNQSLMPLEGQSQEIKKDFSIKIEDFVYMSILHGLSKFDYGESLTISEISCYCRPQIFTIRWDLFIETWHQWTERSSEKKFGISACHSVRKNIIKFTKIKKPVFHIYESFI